MGWASGEGQVGGAGGGVHVKRTGTNNGGRESKAGSSERTYFLNDP